MTTEKEFQSIIQYTLEQLRKQYANVVYENGYPIKAVAQATIESLPALIKYDQWAILEDKLNAEWCKGYEERARQEIKKLSPEESIVVNLLHRKNY